MVDRSNPKNIWDIQAYSTGDGVAGVVYKENGGVTPIQVQTPNTWTSMAASKEMH